MRASVLYPQPVRKSVHIKDWLHTVMMCNQSFH